MDANYVKMLYDKALYAEKVTLHLGADVLNFEKACTDSIIDNPSLDFEGHLHIARYKLRLLKSHPATRF
jgi:hypothetical protein